jgi:hypothetical protein
VTASVHNNTQQCLYVLQASLTTLTNSAASYHSALRCQQDVTVVSNSNTDLVTDAADVEPAVAAVAAAGDQSTSKLPTVADQSSSEAAVHDTVTALLQQQQQQLSQQQQQQQHDEEAQQQLSVLDSGAHDSDAESDQNEQTGDSPDDVADDVVDDVTADDDSTTAATVPIEVRRCHC